MDASGSERHPARHALTLRSEVNPNISLRDAARAVFIAAPDGAGLSPKSNLKTTISIVRYGPPAIPP
jgi:hypothetical protein